MDYDKDLVKDLKIKYFDSLPCAKSLCLFRSGFLFVATESGNHQFYQIQSLGDEDSDVEFTSSNPQEKCFFEPRELTNLALTDELESLSPVIDCQVLNLSNEETPQFYTLCGRGAQSSIKILRNGFQVSEMAVSELPGNPTAVWTVKKSCTGNSFKFLIILLLVV